MAETREALLAEIRQAEDAVLALSSTLTDADSLARWREHDRAFAHLKRLYDAYERGLPRLALSRCPFSGEEVVLAVDTGGLDGSWWDCRRPIRPVETLPATVFACAGAVDLGDVVPFTRHEARPGPGAPHVIAPLLAIPGMKAVVSALTVGGRHAFAIFYFHRTAPLDVVRWNWWGTDHYIAEGPGGGAYSMAVESHEEDFDFDLAEHIEAGRLLWIEPGDGALRLHGTAYDCPFLAATGRREPLRIWRGQSWSGLDSAPADIGETA